MLPYTFHVIYKRGTETLRYVLPSKIKEKKILSARNGNFFCRNIKKAKYQMIKLLLLVFCFFCVHKGNKMLMLYFFWKRQCKAYKRWFFCFSFVSGSVSANVSCFIFRIFDGKFDKDKNAFFNNIWFECRQKY